MSLIKNKSVVSSNDENSWVSGAIKKYPPSDKFDLYFAGSHSKISSQALVKGGACRLSSQIQERSIISQWVESLKNEETTGKLMIDSGAHTMFYTGGTLDTDEYINYLNSLGDYVHIFVQTDKIPNYDSSGRVRDFESAPKYNWENYLYMRSKLDHPEKLLPVFHIGEDYSYLKNMLDWVGPNGEKVPYIGISPRQEDPWSTKLNFMESCFEVIKHSSNPNVKTHALGMTKLSALERLPFTSADSTSWVITAAMGSIMTSEGTIAVSEKSTHQLGHYLRLPKQGKQKIEEYVESFGLTMPLVMKDYNARAVLNVYFLLDWARNYKYTPLQTLRQKTLF